MIEGLDEESCAAVSAADLSGGVAGAGCAALLWAAGAGGGDVLAAAMAAGRDSADLAADALAVLFAGGALEFSCELMW